MIKKMSFWLFIVFFGIHLEASEPQYDISLDAVFNNDVTAVSNALNNLSYGASFTLDQAFNSGSYTYKYVMINDYIYTYDINHTYHVMSSSHMTLMYSPNNKHLVVFASPAGYVYSYMYVDDGYEVQQSDLPNVYDIPNYTLNNDNVDAHVYQFMSKDGKAYTEAIDTDVIFYATYTLDVFNTLTVTTNETFYNVTKNNTNQTVSFNDVIRITAEGDENDIPFSHFENGEGDILSYLNPYVMTASHDIEIIAVYDAGTHDENHISISEIIKADSYIAYAAQLELKSDHVLIEYGFIYGNTETLTVDNESVSVSKNHNKTSYGAFSKTFPLDTVYVRAYMITSSFDGTDVTYHDTYSIIKETPVTRTETFDGLSISPDFSDGTYVGEMMWTYEEGFIRNNQLGLRSTSSLLSDTNQFVSITITFKSYNSSQASFKLFEVINETNNVELETSVSVSGDTIGTLTWSGSAIDQFKIIPKTGYVMILSISWET